MSRSEGGGQKVAGDGARNVSFTADTAGRERLAQPDRYWRHYGAITALLLRLFFGGITVLLRCYSFR
jgi:hypothetical protein